MKRLSSAYLYGMALLLGLLISACRPTYEVAKIEGSQLTVDATLDSVPDAETMALLVPYKQRIDSIMNVRLGILETTIDRFRPESPLGNLVADVLRLAAIRVQEQPADIGLMNIGGIRNSLSEGPITVGHVFEILPFENSLCVLWLKGSDLIRLFESIARRGGDGISGAQLVISADRKLLEARVAGREIEKDKLYCISTINYLAEGNDGMEALLQAEKSIGREEFTVRTLFRDYVEQETASGRKISARIEGRIIIK